MTITKRHTSTLAYTLAYTIVSIVTLLCLAQLFFMVSNRNTSATITGADGEKINPIRIERHSQSILPNDKKFHNNGKTKKIFNQKVASQRGTDIDGALRIDSNGLFYPSKEALDLFDYFLNAAGEESDALILSKIVAYIEDNLQESAQSGALDFLQTYLHYQEIADKTYREYSGDLSNIEDRLALVHELREQAFGAELASRLFSDEQKQMRFALSSYALSKIENISDEQQLKLVREDLSLQLPERQQELLKKMTQPIHLKIQTDKLRDSGASDLEVWQLREKEIGADAADRFAALDERRRQWNKRVDNYKKSEHRLLSQIAHSVERELAVKELQQAQFQGADLRRLQAVLKM